MKVVILILTLMSVLILAGCQQKILVGNDSDEHGCKGSAGYSWCELKQKCLRVWEEPCQENVSVQNITEDNLTNITNITDLPSMTSDEALAIAKESVCVNQSKLIGRPLYEEKTRKWWISMDGVREGCKATCAISEETRTARIEWRCAGPVSLL